MGTLEQSATCANILGSLAGHTLSSVISKHMSQTCWWPWPQRPAWAVCLVYELLPKDSVPLPPLEPSGLPTEWHSNHEWTVPTLRECHVTHAGSRTPGQRPTASKSFGREFKTRAHGVSPLEVLTQWARGRDWGSSVFTNCQDASDDSHAF